MAAPTGFIMTGIGATTPDLYKAEGQVVIGSEGSGKRRVYVINRIYMTIISSGTTRDDGTFSLQSIPPQEDNSVIVVAFDDSSKVYNCKPVDHVTLVPMFE